jgi:hypothetical protein
VQTVLARNTMISGSHPREHNHCSLKDDGVGAATSIEVHSPARRYRSVQEESFRRVRAGQLTAGERAGEVGGVYGRRGRRRGARPGEEKPLTAASRAQRRQRGHDLQAGCGMCGLLPWLHCTEVGGHSRPGGPPAWRWQEAWSNRGRARDWRRAVCRVGGDDHGRRREARRLGHGYRRGTRRVNGGPQPLAWGGKAEPWLPARGTKGGPWPPPAGVGTVGARPQREA